MLIKFWKYLKRATDEERFENCINRGIECDKIAGDNETLNATLQKYEDKTFRNDSFQIYWSKF